MKPIPELCDLVAPLRDAGQVEVWRVAREAGIPPGTLYRLALGYAEGCHYNTARKLSVWLSQNRVKRPKAAKAAA